MTHLMNHILLALAVIGAYAVFLLIHPDKPCRRCRGWGVKGRRRKSCPRCGATGIRFRAGARLVHRGKALIIRRYIEWRDS